MPHTVVLHAFRRGTGKTAITAQLARLLAQAGLAVGALDLHLQAPGLHTALELEHPSPTLNDELQRPSLAGDLGHQIALPDAEGRLILVPASSSPADIAAALGTPLTIELLHDLFAQLTEQHGLDTLLLDTQPGITEETLRVLGMADLALIVLRLDEQDYMGTAVLISVLKRLGGPQLHLIVNDVPADYNAAQVISEISAAFGCPVAAVIPHTSDGPLLSPLIDVARLVAGLEREDEDR